MEFKHISVLFNETVESLDIDPYNIAQQLCIFDVKAAKKLEMSDYMYTTSKFNDYLMKINKITLFVKEAIKLKNVHSLLMYLIIY